MLEYIIYGCLFMIGYKSASIYLQPCKQVKQAHDKKELDDIIKQYSIVKDNDLDVPV